jgi:hypothetical protein
MKILKINMVYKNVCSVNYGYLIHACLWLLKL